MYVFYANGKGLNSGTGSIYIEKLGDWEKGWEIMDMGSTRKTFFLGLKKKILMIFF